MINKVHLCIILIFSCVTSSPIFAKPLLKPDIDNAEYFSETFTLFADLDDGAYIYGQIGVSNIGPGDQRGICRVLASLPQQLSFNQSVIVNENEWSFTDSPHQVLSVKNCRLSYNLEHQFLEFHGELMNEKINIVLHKKPKKHKVPFDRLLMESGFYQSDIIVPWSAASVEYSINGEKKEVRGYGYADHSRSTLLPATLAYQWVRFRSVRGDSAQLLLARQPAEDEDFEGWRWQQQNLPVILKNLTLINNQTDEEQPWTINFQENKQTYRIKIEKFLIRYAPMEEKGFLTKMISFFVGNPVTYTYRAQLIAEDGTRTSGILEIAKINGD